MKLHTICIKMSQKEEKMKREGRREGGRGRKQRGMREEKGTLIRNVKERGEGRHDIRHSRGRATVRPRSGASANRISQKRESSRSIPRFVLESASTVPDFWLAWR